MRVFKGLVSTAALICLPVSAHAGEVTQLIFFGDSNLDVGRVNSEATGGAGGDGIRPPPSTIAGRSSNGAILPEFLVRELGVSQLNFSWGGATSGALNIVGYRGLPDVMETGTLAQLAEFEAFLGGYPADPVALYTVIAGSNDIALIDKNDQAAIDEAVDGVVQNLRYVVTQLDALGAEQIVVGTRTPRPVLSDHNRPEEEPDEAARNDAAGRQMNIAIRALVSELDEALEADIELFDTYAVIREIADNAEAHGFAAYDDSEAGYCVSNEDCTGLINHDGAHKTSAVHELLAEAFIDQFELDAAD